MPETVDDWFVREVLPHEAALLRYLARVWPNPADIHDIRHDAYVRILEGAGRLKPIAPKSLLFSIARNLMIDRARRNRVVPIDLLADLDSLNILVDEVTPERRASIRVFDRTPLAQAVAEFDRYSKRKIVIADPSIAAIRIGGNFRVTNVEAFVRLIASDFPIVVLEEEDRIVLRAAAPEKK